MYNQIRMPLACFVLLAYILIYYSTKDRLRTKNARVFEVMAVCGLVHVLSSIITEYTVNNRDRVPPLFNHIWHIVFLISCSGLCALLYLYLIHYVERGTGLQKKKSKYALAVVLLISVIGELVLPITYVDTEFGSYSLGMKAYSLYVVVIYSLFMMVYTIIRYRKFLPADRCVLLLSSVAAFVVISVIQIIFPHILLTGFAATFIVMGIMFNTEDVHMYISGSNNYYNELGCREILNEAVLNGTPFQIGIYIFVGKDEDIRAGMRSISPQLPERKLHAICGGIADNCMLLIPMSGRKSISEISELPKPKCDDVNLFMDVLNITPGQTVDEILTNIKNLKNQYEESVLQRDDLTGLLRRAPYIRQVEQMICRNQDFTFLMIDLDNFKQVNDRYGHGTGDILLKDFADLLRWDLQNEDILCRMGGDEFSVVLTNLATREKVLQLVNRLQDHFAGLESVQNVGGIVTLSVGARVTNEQDRAGSFQQIYAEADAALYQSKYRGKKRLTFSYIG